MAATASLAVHLGVLTALLQRDEPAPLQTPPTIEISLLRPAEPVAEATPAPARATDALMPEPLNPQARAARIRPGAVAPPLLSPFPIAPAGPRAPGVGLPGPAPGPAPGAAGPPSQAHRPPARPGPAPDPGEGVRSALRLAGCETGTARLTPRERELCRERFGSAVTGEEMAPPSAWANKRREDEAEKGRSLLSKEVPGPCRGVCIRFGEPPKALPNIPASTLRGDDDALRPKPRPKPEEPPT